MTGVGNRYCTSSTQWQVPGEKRLDDGQGPFGLGFSGGCVDFGKNVRSISAPNDHGVCKAHKVEEINLRQVGSGTAGSQTYRQAGSYLVAPNDAEPTVAYRGERPMPVVSGATFRLREGRKGDERGGQWRGLRKHCRRRVVVFRGERTRWARRVEEERSLHVAPGDYHPVAFGAVEVRLCRRAFRLLDASIGEFSGMNDQALK